MLLLLLGNMPMLFGQYLKECTVYLGIARCQDAFSTHFVDDLPKVEFSPKSALECLFDRAQEGVKSYLGCSL